MFACLRSNHSVAVSFAELAAFFKLPRHDRICPLYGACLEPVCFVSPFLPHGSLKQLLDRTREKKLSATEQKAIGECALLFSSCKFSFACCLLADVTRPTVVLALAVYLCEALTVLHGANLVHRDIAARNVLLDDKWRPVLTDFGLSRTASKSTESGV